MARLLAAFLSFAALACGGDPANEHPGTAAYRLAAVGETGLVLHPGETRTVRVVLARDEVGGVAGALVHFEVAGDGGALTSGSHDVATGAGGVASLALTAGARTGSAEVIANAPGFEAPEVSFTVEVVPVRKLLRIVPGPGTLVDEGGRTASVLVSASGSAPLRVREIDADTGAPIAGDAILFSVPAGARSTLGSAGGKSARATTNAAGEAQAFLLAGAVEPGFEAAAFSAAGDEGVYFAVTVLGERTGSCEVECPAGYQCVDGACEPGTVPKDPALPDVTGTWYTKHVFAIRDSLPPALREAFAGIRALDQFLSGRLGLPAWLQSVIDALLEQFLPGWFYAVVRLGDDLGTLLSFLRAEGRMRLSPGADPAHPSGTEVWNSLVFYWLPLCGEEIAGDPAVPPDCARLDVATTDAGDAFASRRCRGEVLPAVSVRAAPFSAAVLAVPGSAPARYQLAVERRQVDVDVANAVVSAIDAALSLATPWQCIAEATDCRGGQECVVDCAGMGRWVDEFTSGVLGAGLIERACAGAVGLAGRTVTEALGSIRFRSNLLVFGGRASIGGVGDDDSTCRSGSSCAGQLGNDGFDGDLRQRPAARDGSWTGAFFADSPGEMPGSWEAKRAHFQ
ncbi:MAG: hypothetical protein E6J64_10585 [Deltaproteobacteria bacterium]|nr:MAG: hypothetical protein E6J64_10585 [Deltaproteobacteria bacterium]